MPEAVGTGPDRFAPLAQGAVSSKEEAHVPREPMITSQPTSASRAAVSRIRRSRLALAGVLALLALLLAASPAAALSTEYEFTVIGHGWGHGVGMSQWGAYGYAKHGWEYKAILKHYYTGIGFSTVADSTIRVNLRSGLSAVKVSCGHDYTVQGTGAATTIPGGTTATTTYTSLGYRVVAGSMRKTFTGAPTFTPTSGSLNLLTATDLGDTGLYRGTDPRPAQRRRTDDDQRCAARELPAGRRPARGPYEWPMEALKTQACAARAFALGSRQPDKAWDVYCDVRDQAYVGVGIENPRTTAAVDQTAGVCPTYDGKPIVATYFSCSGGQTEDVKYVWGGDYPYLKAVDDPRRVNQPRICPTYNGKPIVPRTSRAPAGRPRTSSTCGAATIRISSPWTIPTTPTPRCTTGDRCAAPRPRSARRSAPSGRCAPCTRSSTASRRGSSRRRSSAAAAPSTSTAAPCA